MSANTPEEFGEWLFSRIGESPLGQEVPRENLHLICERAAKFFYADGRLETKGLFEWLSAEYNLPWPRLAEVFSGFKPAAAEIGVEIVIAAPPGDNDTMFDEGALPHENSLAREDGSPPGAESDEDDDESMAVLASEVEEEKASAAAATRPTPVACAPTDGASVQAARPRRPWQMLPPKWRDPERSLSGFLADGKYLEFAYFDHLLDGVARKEPRIGAILNRMFRPADAERELFKDVAVEPGTDADTIEAWTLRINAKALAYAYALDLAQNQINFDMTEWLRGVRQMNASYGDISSKILAKNAEAKGKGGCAPAAFEKAWTRLRTFHNDVQPESERLAVLAAGKENEDKEKKRAASKKAAANAQIGQAVEVDFGTGPMAFIRKNQLLVMIVAGLLLALTAGYGVFSTGVFKDSGITEVAIDVSGSGLTPTRVFTNGAGVVLVVGLDQWSSRSREQKEEALKALYDAAVKAGYRQVQVWSPEDKTLGMALSRDVIKVLQ